MNASILIEKAMNPISKLLEHIVINDFILFEAKEVIS
jgi:hypothetical protein